MARWTACGFFWLPMPSTVVMSHPSQDKTGQRHWEEKYRTSFSSIKYSLKNQKKTHFLVQLRQTPSLLLFSLLYWVHGALNDFSRSGKVRVSHVDCTGAAAAFTAHDFGAGELEMAPEIVIEGLARKRHWNCEEKCILDRQFESINQSINSRSWNVFSMIGKTRVFSVGSTIDIWPCNESMNQWIWSSSTRVLNSVDFERNTRGRKSNSHIMWRHFCRCFYWRYCWAKVHFKEKRKEETLSCLAAKHRIS